MKILTLGFLMFIAWAALSTHIYVCMIKGFCYVPKNKSTTLISSDIRTAPDARQIKMPEIAPIQDYIIYYATGEYQFKPDSEIDKWIEESKVYLEQNIQSKLQITGYTDSVGTIKNNYSLAFSRAQNIQEYFISKGMLSNSIEIESKGEQFPSGNNKQIKFNANNRKSVITIIK